MRMSGSPTYNNNIHLTSRPYPIRITIVLCSDFENEAFSSHVTQSPLSGEDFRKETSPMHNIQTSFIRNNHHFYSSGADYQQQFQTIPTRFQRPHISLCSDDFFIISSIQKKSKVPCFLLYSLVQNNLAHMEILTPLRDQTCSLGIKVEQSISISPRVFQCPHIFN